MYTFSPTGPASFTHSQPVIISQPKPPNPPAPETLTSAPTSKAKARGRPKGSKNKNKSDVQPKDSQLVAMETVTTRDWTVEEMGALFEHMLGERVPMLGLRNYKLRRIRFGVW